MNAEIAFNAGLRILAILFASNAQPCARHAAVKSAVAIALGWIFYVSSWLENSPHSIVEQLTGVSVPSTSLWALSDCLIGLYVAEQAIDRIWGRIIVGVFGVQIAAHLVYHMNFVPFEDYSAFLDYGFMIQIMAFIWIGSDGARDRIGCTFRRWRHGVDKSKAISTREASGE